MSDLPRVAVLGAGRIARMFHLPALARLGASVAVVADPDVHARQEAGRVRPDARLVDDWRDAVAASDVEAVVVCLPSHLHVEAASAAFDAGRHVYVEKPLALDIDGAQRVERAWRRSGRTGAVGFNFRFQPLVVDARRRIAAGELGRLVAVRALVCSPPRDLPGWKRRRRTGGGALLDLAVHHLDLAAHLTDRRVVEVAAHVRSVATDGDTAALTLTLEGGLDAQVLASSSSRQTDAVEVLGDRATLWFDRFRSDRVEIAPAVHGDDRRARARAGRREAGGALRRVVRTVAPAPEISYAASLGAFLRAAAAGIQPRPSIADGVRIARLVDAAERSVAAGGEPRSAAAA